MKINPTEYGHSNCIFEIRIVRNIVHKIRDKRNYFRTLDLCFMIYDYCDVKKFFFCE